MRNKLLALTIIFICSLNLSAQKYVYNTSVIISNARIASIQEVKQISVFKVSKTEVSWYYKDFETIEFDIETTLVDVETRSFIARNRVSGDLYVISIRPDNMYMYKLGGVNMGAIIFKNNK